MGKGVVTMLTVSIALMLCAPSVLGQTSKPPGQTATPIRIGGAISLTGRWAETGKWVKEGYDLWLDEINKKGGLPGRPVEMIVYDNESDTDKGIAFDSRGLPASFFFTVLTTGGQNKLVWPKELATTQSVYPKPPWGN